MGNPAQPGQKLALLVIPAALDGVYGFDKGFLEQILCSVTVLYNQVNGRINARFVTMEEHFESLFVTLLIKRNQLAVAASFVYHSVSRLGNVELYIDSVRVG